MKHVNVEIKAVCKDHDKIREILRSKSADFRGVDTYFKVAAGRLKLRHLCNNIQAGDCKE